MKSLHRATTGGPTEWHVVARHEDQADPEKVTRYSILRRREVWDTDPKTGDRRGGEPRGIEWLFREQSPYNYRTLAEAIAAASKMGTDGAAFWKRLTALAERQRAKAPQVLA